MKDGSPSIVVLFDSARSAEPPHSSGSTGASAFSTSPEALRVAIDLPASKVGRASSQPAGSLRALMRSNSATRSGLAARHSSNRSFHSACRARPRSATSRACLRISSGTSKLLDGSRPRTSLVAATSSAPRAEPWILPVFCLFGAGQPMIVRSLISVGRSVSSTAAR